MAAILHRFCEVLTWYVGATVMCLAVTCTVFNRGVIYFVGFPGRCKIKEVTHEAHWSYFLPSERRFSVLWLPCYVMYEHVYFEKRFMHELVSFRITVEGSEASRTGAIVWSVAMGVPQETSGRTDPGNFLILDPQNVRWTSSVLCLVLEWWDRDQVGNSYPSFIEELK